MTVQVCLARSIVTSDALASYSRKLRLGHLDVIEDLLGNFQNCGEAVYQR